MTSGVAHESDPLMNEVRRTRGDPPGTVGFGGYFTPSASALDDKVKRDSGIQKCFMGEAGAGEVPWSWNREECRSAEAFRGNKDLGRGYPAFTDSVRASQRPARSRSPDAPDSVSVPHSPRIATVAPPRSRVGDDPTADPPRPSSPW